MSLSGSYRTMTLVFQWFDWSVDEPIFLVHLGLLPSRLEVQHKLPQWFTPVTSELVACVLKLFVSKDWVLALCFQVVILRLIVKANKRQFYPVIFLDHLKKSYVTNHFRLPALKSVTSGVYMKTDPVLLPAAESLCCESCGQLGTRNALSALRNLLIWCVLFWQMSGESTTSLQVQINPRPKTSWYIPVM